MDSKNYCCNLHQRVFCLCFPLGVFTVFGPTFRSIIHFQFTFGQRSLVGYNPQGHKTVEYDLATKQWACLQIVVLVREQESLEVPFL